MLEFVLIWSHRNASCFVALAKFRPICWGLVLLLPNWHFCTGGRVIMPHGCKYCWNGYYQGPGRPRRHGLPGRAYRVQMVGSADPAILPWSVRPIRPSRLGWFGRAFRADIVDPAYPTITTRYGLWWRFLFSYTYSHVPNAASLPQSLKSIYQLLRSCRIRKEQKISDSATRK